MASDRVRSDEYLIQGGTVLANDGAAELDVLVRNGIVADLGRNLAAERAEVVDATGCWVGPGFVDIHTHLREPGGEHQEDIASGSAAAAAGGYTAVMAMPNTQPPIDSGPLARFVLERGRAVGLLDVAVAGTISANREGTRLAHLDELWDAGVRMFTDDGDSVADAGLLRRAMEYVGELGGVVAQHAVDEGLAAGGHMHEGEISSRLGLQGIAGLAEEVTLARDLSLVRLTGVRYHAQHVSTASGFDLIAAAKAQGLPVTAEVTPHHLAFDHTRLATGDPMFKMMPPLRDASDVTAARHAVASGVVDTVATDHAPHAPHEKEVPFEQAPFGVTGLEWAAAVVNSIADLEIESFFDRLSVSPARIAQMNDGQGARIKVGRTANLVVFDPEAMSRPTTTRSRSRNSPYLDQEWRGVVRATFFEGQRTHISDRVVA